MAVDPVSRRCELCGCSSRAEWVFHNITAIGVAALVLAISVVTAVKVTDAKWKKDAIANGAAEETIVAGGELRFRWKKGYSWQDRVRIQQAIEAGKSK